MRPDHRQEDISPRPEKPGRIELGKHMTVRVSKLQDVSPDQLPRILGIPPESLVGKIDVLRNMPQLTNSDNWIAFARELYSSSLTALHELAALCEKDDPRLKGVELFTGLSHLANSAEKLGFEVYPIENESFRKSLLSIAKGIVRQVARKNQNWQSLEKNMKPPQFAVIRRQELVRRYGSKRS